MVGTVTMVARIRVLPGMQEKFESVFARRRAKAYSHEPKTLKYDLYGETAAPLVYTVVEEFADADGLQAHLDGSTDHEELMACFDGTPEVHTLYSISPLPLR
jgi:quinol monooxygenase YgiN